MKQAPITAADRKMLTGVRHNERADRKMRFGSEDAISAGQTEYRFQP